MQCCCTVSIVVGTEKLYRTYNRLRLRCKKPNFKKLPFLILPAQILKGRNIKKFKIFIFWSCKFDFCWCGSILTSSCSRKKSLLRHRNTCDKYTRSCAFCFKRDTVGTRYRISKLYFVTFLDSGKILYSVGTLCNYELPIILFDHFRETILLKQLPVPVKFCFLYLTLMMMCL